VWLESRDEYAARYPASAARTREQQPPGELAVACLPLELDGVVRGALVFSFTDARRFDEVERSFVVLLTQACAHALERARLYGAERAARERAAFLAEASALLAGSLDYQATLQSVARLAVPRIADWCAVDLADDETGPARVVVHHVDPDKIELAESARRRWPPDPEATQGVARVIRSGEAELYPEIPDGMIDALPDPEQRAVLRTLGLRSALIVPMRAHARSVGAITLVAAESGRRFHDADLAMAEQLGERAGMAISNARLYEQAVRAIEMRDDFLSIAGHELKTPLTALLMQAQAMARMGAELPARVGERLDKMERIVDRMRLLIDELLDVSRISAGRLQLQLEEVELASVVRENVARMAEDFGRAGSQARVDAGSALCGRWDRSRIEQVVTNLLSNAIKYGKGKPIEIRAEAVGRDAVLTVRDHGIGIAPDDQARIFERFERAVSSRHFGGLGLGLWITRQIVEAHGGTIAVDSEPGRGAEFRVTLPMSGEAPP
jgi:signal transduction histidine kinase